MPSNVTGGSDPPEIGEDVDLDIERRRYILVAHAQLGQLTHYALLGVGRTADRKAVKDAYFRLAGLVHPDRYFGKRLGSYKRKMEVLFAQISIAYETLSRAKTRAEYDATLGVGAVDEGRQSVTAPVDPRLIAKRQAALEGLTQHFAASKAKAHEYAEVGARARAAGDLAAAAEAYRSAVTFAPADRELASSLENVEREWREKLGASHKQKALMEERFGRWAAAALSWEQVVALSPDDTEARTRLANATARAAR